MKNFKQLDCFSMNLMYFKFLGIYPLDNIVWPFYSYYSKIFILIFVIIFVILCTMSFFFLTEGINSFIEEMIFYFTEISTLSKVLTFSIMRNEIKNILNILESDTFQPEFSKGIKILNEAKAFNLLYWKIVAGISVIANIANFMSPLLMHIMFKEDLVFLVSSYSFLPNSLTKIYAYYIFAYQGIGIYMLMLYNINIDTFFVGLMILIIAQLKILREKLTDTTKSEYKEAVGNIDEINTFVLQNIETDLILKLNNAIEHYFYVAKFCRRIENVFSVTLFVQFGLSSCIICICLVKLTMPAPWQYYIFLSSYVIVMIGQIMAPCWFGTRIMEESVLLSQAVYNCNWMPRSRTFKKNMRLFVQCAKRPLSITGLKMFPLSLTTFTSIMNSAYSFFTLLRNVQSN